MLALVLLIVVLGVLIFLHEFGHYITSKKFGAYVYEFSIGMGPKIFSFKRKKKNDPTEYSLRLFPIGGYCAIAGETSEDDGMDVKLKKNEYMCNKPIWQRCIILIAGVTMNFLSGFIILFISALLFGSVNNASYVGRVEEGYPISEAGIEVGDRILKIDGKSAKSWDKITLLLNYKHKSKTYIFTVEKKDGSVKDYKIKPIISKDKEGNEIRTFGLGQNAKKQKGLWVSFKNSVAKFFTIIDSMWSVIINLINGNLSLNALSGPVGVYSVMGEAAHTSIDSVLFIAAYLSINLGFINILPFPAFDGGRVLFLIIEKIRKKKMKPKVENMINTIGFVLLIILMIVITIKDILKLV